MSEILEIAKGISELGILVIIAAVFLYGNIVSNKRRDKKYDEMFERVMSLSDQHHHPDPEETDALDLLSNTMHDILEETLNKLNADRCYICSYHNGGVSTYGTSFQKMSCTNEVVAVGVLPMITETQNIHKGPYKSIMNSFRENEAWYIVKDCEELKEADAFMYSRFVLRHATSCMFRAIRDNDGYILGFIGVDFSHKIEGVSDVATIQVALDIASKKLSNLLGIRKGLDDK